jgi:D-alanyl-D-alanine carboxypeptidase
MDYTVLVNKDHLIKDSDLPKNLVIVGKMEQPTIPIADGETDDILLEEKAAKYFLKMMNDFNSTHSNKIAPDSGYRSIDRQKRLLEYYYSVDGEKALTYAAIPRASEHHTGLAIDIVLIVNGEYMDKITGEEDEIKDLISMCYKYGFILRYPKGKENITGFIYEPWHFRFVGLELAQKAHDSGLVLEEIL